MVSRADGWWDETGDGMGGWVNGRTVGAEEDSARGEGYYLAGKRMVPVGWLVGFQRFP